MKLTLYTNGSNWSLLKLLTKPVKDSKGEQTRNIEFNRPSAVPFDILVHFIKNKPYWS